MILCNFVNSIIRTVISPTPVKYIGESDGVDYVRLNTFSYYSLIQYTAILDTRI